MNGTPFSREDQNKFSRILSRKANIHEVLGEELGPTFHAYRERWEAAACFATRPAFPIHIDFELNYSCNLKCPMCTWSAETNIPGKGMWMDFSLFARIVDEGVPQGLASIGLDWINEPTIRKDLPRFLDYAHRAGVIESIVHSNATLMTPTLADELIHSGLTRMMFSLDAATRDTYEKIRVGAKFDRVVRNIHEFIERRNRLGKRLPLVSVNFVRMSTNAHELEQFLEYWEPYVDFFAVQQYQNPFQGQTQPDDLFFAEGREVVTDFRCHQPWLRLTIRYDGRVLPCCSFYAERLVIGDMRQQSCKEIWNSRPLRELQDLHTRGQYEKNAVCLECAKNSVVDLVAPAPLKIGKE
jgi:radical SAM protein with 4Fe4S-binding SPASM domain